MDTDVINKPVSEQEEGMITPPLRQAGIDPEWWARAPRKPDDDDDDDEDDDDGEPERRRPTRRPIIPGARITGDINGQ